MHNGSVLLVGNASCCLQGAPAFGWICYHGVGVCNEVAQGIQKALVLHHLCVDVVQLGHANSRSLAHVGVLILQALAERLTQVLGDLIHPDAPHGAHGQGADQWVGVLTVLQGRKKTGTVSALCDKDFIRENKGQPSLYP